MSVIRASVSILVFMVLAASVPAGAGTLDDVKERGYIRCGVSTGLPGFSMQDGAGTWQGLDVDMCRAVAAAVLGDADKVRYTPLTVETRLEALREGDIDILSHNTTWTMERDTTLGLDCAGINYYDGQGFMTRRGLGVRSALALDGATVCVLEGTTSDQNLKDYFTIHRMRHKALPLKTPEETVRAYEAGRCSVLTSDQSQLYALRSQLANPGDSIILPEVISKEPLGPYVREGDDAWFDTVRWSLYTMINAEEAEVHSKNVERIRKKSKNPDIRRLLGLEGNTGGHLELHKDWAVNIIQQVGNYGESFDRNVGTGSPLGIKRGLNALWKDGGLQYAPPAR